MDNLVCKATAYSPSVAMSAEQKGTHERYFLSFDRTMQLARSVFLELVKFRCRLSSEDSCTASSCQACLAPHLPKLIHAIAQGKTINLVLPAFPGKSPNPAKVLGPLPDLAERRALERLNQLCERIATFYSPGARLILCSDGRVFSDVVGMGENDVSDYQHELGVMIDSLSLSHITTFNLDELYRGEDFNRMRLELMRQFGQPLASLKEKVRRGRDPSSAPEDREAHRMYCGITRFLVEDASHPGQSKSRTAIQKECKKRAYEVILRSNAWSELIAQRFPEALRLSIHPQGCGAKKFPIQLMGTDCWMTPWHGVAVDTGDEFILLKRAQAEALGAQLLHFPEGRPSHYTLAEDVDSVQGGSR